MLASCAWTLIITEQVLASRPISEPVNPTSLATFLATYSKFTWVLSTLTSPSRTICYLKIMMLILKNENTYHSCFNCGFHGTFSVWINLKNGIKNTIWNLIAEFIWMSFTYWFRGKINVFAIVLCWLHFAVLFFMIY